MTTFSLPRLAIGSADSRAQTQPVLWALMEVLRRHDIQVQTFFSQARFIPESGSAAISGRSPRHLDSWLMPQAVCQEILQHGMFCKDLAIVGGRYDCANGAAQGGSLDTLCRWLELPRIGILSADMLAPCRLPAQPPPLDGVLLDRVVDLSQLAWLQSTLQARWGAPLLGWLAASAWPGHVGELAQPPAASPELCRVLGDALAPTLNIAGLMSIADSRKRFPDAGPRLFRETHCEKPLRIAVAYDDAFHCYFADDLELLELRGAALADFSPLRDDQLPAATDIVYIGCGAAERFVPRLSGNACMHHALRDFARRGGRIYAEGGGMAYLCRQLVNDDGSAAPMSGVLPATARRRQAETAPQAVETSLLRRSWLTGGSKCLRGYRNPYWTIQGEPPLEVFAAGEDGEIDVAGCGNVLASRLHVQFAARQELLDAFFQPNAAEQR